jgi:hypothetical protein
MLLWIAAMCRWKRKMTPKSGQKVDLDQINQKLIDRSVKKSAACAAEAVSHRVTMNRLGFVVSSNVPAPAPA